MNWWQHLSQIKRKDKPVIVKPREKNIGTHIYNSHEAKKADQCQTPSCQLKKQKKDTKAKAKTTKKQDSTSIYNSSGGQSAMY